MYVVDGNDNVLGVSNSAEILSPTEGALRPSWWAPGLNARERLSAPVHPEWAMFIERAIAASADRRAVASDVEWHVAFAAALAPLTLAARLRVAERIGRLDLLDGWSAQLGRRLAVIAARTLVLELHNAGQLGGDTPEERFTEFVRTVDLARLLTAYPVLARLLGQECLYAADALVELVRRFDADRPSIVETLLDGADPGALVGVETCRGDTHRRGRAVATLHFAGGATIVYKPRSLTMHQRFSHLVTWLNGRLPELDLHAARVLDRPDHGWMEFVTVEPCDDAPLFYRRQGALLALLYAVDGADVHCENLVAHGSQPILVDVETLFHPDLAGYAGDPAADALSRSVRRTALLPRVLVGEHGALDMSGLGGDHGALYPTDVPGWEAPGTDRMRLIRRAAPFTGTDNRPRVDGRVVDPAEYRASLLAGFRAAYDAITTHRDEFSALLTTCADDEIRVVVRPTAYYATFLDESTHPDVLRDALDRDGVLGQLVEDVADDAARLRLVPHELDDLWAGDVPLFTARPGSRDLWSSDGRRIPDVLTEPSLATALAKVRTMGERDRRRQEWLIDATLATRPGARVLAGGAPARRRDLRERPADFLDAARRIADDLADRSIHDRRRVNWIGLELLDGRHWTVGPLGASLGQGYPGVALFLAELAAVTGEQRYGALARAALRPLPRLFDELTGDPELAGLVGDGFDGLGGIAYALTRTAALLDGGTPSAAGDATVEAARVAGQPPRADLSLGGGELGVLDALTVLADAGDADARRELRRRAGTILDRPLHCGTPGGVPSPGLLTGLAGIGYGLLRLGFSARVPSLLPLHSAPQISPTT